MVSTVVLIFEFPSWSLIITSHSIKQTINYKEIKENLPNAMREIPEMIFVSA